MTCNNVLKGHLEQPHHRILSSDSKVNSYFPQSCAAIAFKWQHHNRIMISWFGSYVAQFSFVSETVKAVCSQTIERRVVARS